MSTQPDQQPQPISQETAQSWEHADQVSALAGTAAASLTGRAHDLLKVLLAAALARWAASGVSGSIRDLIAFRQWFAAEVDRVAGSLPDPLRLVPALEDALRLGARQAVVESGASPLGRRELTLDAQLLGHLSTVRARQEGFLADAGTLISVARDRGDVVKAFALADRAVTYTDQATAGLVHDAARSGMDQVAAADGWQQICIGERNCCLRCASFQGAIAEPPDFVFHPVLAGAWLTAGDHMGATIPFHPHCRDRGRLVRADQARVSSVMDPGSLTNVLRREARRSIVLGLALPSESQAARRRAAAQLLARRGGAGLPKSVEARARRRIASGQFRTRAVITTGSK